MKIRNFILCLFCLGGMFIAVGTTITPTAMNNINQSEIKPSVYYPEMNIDFTETDLSIIKRIANQTAKEREYIPMVWDCENYSLELMSRLRQQGYEASCEAGYFIDDPNTWKAGDNPHEWVLLNLNNQMIRIEATSGKLLNPDYFNQHYKIMRENYC